MLQSMTEYPKHNAISSLQT